MEALKRFCIQLADTVFRRRYRNIEHRKFIRLSDSLVTAIRLVDCESRKPFSKRIMGSTANISREGLCIESSTATVDGIDIFNDAMSPEKCLDIELDPAGTSAKLNLFGNVVWLDMTPKDMSFLFKAGVHLDLKNNSEKESWYAVVDRAKRDRRNRSWLYSKLHGLFRQKQR